MKSKEKWSKHKYQKQSSICIFFYGRREKKKEKRFTGDKPLNRWYNTPHRMKEDVVALLTTWQLGSLNHRETSHASLEVHGNYMLVAF
jgi:hypothetical protein